MSLVGSLKAASSSARPRVGVGVRGGARPQVGTRASGRVRATETPL